MRWPLRLPNNPELTGETPPGAPSQDPFIYCAAAGRSTQKGRPGFLRPGHSNAEW